MFEIYCRSLNINPTVNLFRAFYKLNNLKHWKERFFLIDRRAILDAMSLRHKNSSMADPPPTGVQAEDIHRLCEKIIDLRSVHPTMLYEIGLTTIWKNVGHHPVFKDGDRNVEHEDERVLAAQRKARATKDKAVGKRSAAEGNDTKVKSPHSASSPYFEHFLQSQHSAHSDEDTHAHSNGDGLYHDERGEHARRHASSSTCRVLSSSPGDSARQVYSQQNHGGDKI
ncbi:hypothetical protein Tco_1207846, partial [Tanacetum coccineum]